MYEDEILQIMGEAPEEVIRLLDKADSLFEKGDIEGAEKAYREVFEYEPVNERALEALSNLYIQQDKYEEAEEVWEQASNYVETQTWFYLGRMARIYEERDMLVDAERILRRSVKKTPYSGMAHVALGAFYERQGRVLDAMQAYYGATRAEPRDEWFESNIKRLIEETVKEGIIRAIWLVPVLLYEVGRRWRQSGGFDQNIQVLVRGLRARVSDMKDPSKLSSFIDDCRLLVSGIQDVIRLPNKLAEAINMVPLLNPAGGTADASELSRIAENAEDLIKAFTLSLKEFTDDA